MTTHTPKSNPKQSAGETISVRLDAALLAQLDHYIAVLKKEAPMPWTVTRGSTARHLIMVGLSNVEK